MSVKIKNESTGETVEVGGLTGFAVSLIIILAGAALFTLALLFFTAFLPLFILLIVVAVVGMFLYSCYENVKWWYRDRKRKKKKKTY